jgi:phage-related minor tail protein
LLKTIVHLRESLKQEQERATLLETRLIKLDTVEGNQLARKNAQLEEEKKLSLEYMRTIEQLRATLKQEQEQSVEVQRKKIELEAKVNKLDEVEENQLAKKNVLLEEEKKKSTDYAQLVDQLRESIKQDQTKMAGMVKHTDELEDKVKDLSVVLSKIASLATGGNLDSKSGTFPLS